MTLLIGSLVRLARVHDTHSPKIRGLLGRVGVVRGYVRKPVERYEVEFWDGAVVWVGTDYFDLFEVLPRCSDSQLSPTESRVLHHIAAGRTDQQIAVTLCRSITTINSHRDAVLRKLGARNRTEAAVRFLYGVGPGYTAEIAGE